VDVIISNCVMINLAAANQGHGGGVSVLKPGGRFAVSECS